MNSIKEDIPINNVDYEQELRDSLNRALLTNKTSKSLDEKILQSDYVFQNSVDAHLYQWIRVSINELTHETIKSKSLDLKR
jgi:hypothetical protein